MDAIPRRQQPSEEVQTFTDLPELPEGKQSEEGSPGGGCNSGSDCSSVRIWGRITPAILSPDAHFTLLSCVS